MPGVNLIPKLTTFVPANEAALDGDVSGGLLDGGGSLDLSGAEKVRLLLAGLGLAAIPLGGQYIDGMMQEIANQKQAEIAQMDTKIQEERNKLAGLSGLQEQIASYDQQMRVLQEKLQLVEAVQQNRNSLIRMVDFVVSQLPNEVWMRRLEVNIQQGVGNPDSKISVAGSALTLQSVSEFLKKLENAVFFPSWDLTQTQSAPSGGGAAPGTDPLDAKTFEITSRIVSL
jgi:Tfp pilus assembly protein PilN